MMAFGKIGLEAQGFLQADHCLFKMSQLSEGITKVAMRRGEFWSRAHRLSKTVGGLGQLPLQDEHVAQVVMRFGEIRLQAHALFEVIGSLIMTARLRGY